MSKFRDIHIDENILYPKEKREYNLLKNYELCVDELGVQQTKRDKIISFFITIVGVAIPLFMQLNLSLLIKTIPFFAIFLLGSIFSIVVIRYKNYKDIYWISCKVISKLSAVEVSLICTDLVKGLFLNILKDNAKGALVYNNSNKVNSLKTFKKMLYSAETMIFEALVIINGLILTVGIIMLGYGINKMVELIVVSIIVFFVNIFVWNRIYYKVAINVFDGINNDEKFNSAFGKAWFLHFTIV